MKIILSSSVDVAMYLFLYGAYYNKKWVTFVSIV